MGLIIRSSTIHAAGCYTTSQIAKGSLVAEYTGPIIDKDEADVLYEGKPITYLFAIGDGTRVIDGHGMAMFINHSCDANCETEEIDERIWIRAIRNIAAGEEICYDYCLFDGEEEDAPCNCGTKKCRGSMYSPDELKRRRREAAKAAAADRASHSTIKRNDKRGAVANGGNGTRGQAVKPRKSEGLQRGHAEPATRTRKSSRRRSPGARP